jgi:hypothetical protein
MTSIYRKQAMTLRGANKNNMHKKLFENNNENRKDNNVKKAGQGFRPGRLFLPNL